MIVRRAVATAAGVVQRISSEAYVPVYQTIW